MAIEVAHSPPCSDSSVKEPPPKKAKGEHQYTFPPFPQPPEGVTIVSFRDYQEAGIQMEPDAEGREVDGHGIPTIVMPKRHDIDRCKTDARTAVRLRNATTGPAGGGMINASSGGAQKQWWELWAAQSDHFRAYDPKLNVIDRLHQSTAHFTSWREWGPQENGRRRLFDQWCLFIGRIKTTPVWNKVAKKPIGEDEMSDDDDDDDYDDDDQPYVDDEEEFEEATSVTIKENDYSPRGGRGGRGRGRGRGRGGYNNNNTARNPNDLKPRPPYDLYMQKPIKVTSDEEIQGLLSNENARAEERIIEFLEDPARNVQIFLSSYMRDQGLIWYDRNLINAPYLLYFYLKFLLQHRVYTSSDPHIDKGFNKALAVIEKAQKEMILTSRMAKVFPDDISKGLGDLWGSRSEVYNAFMLDPEFGDNRMEEVNEEEKFKESLAGSNVHVVPESSWGSTGWGDTTASTAGWGNPSSGDTWGISDDTPTLDASKVSDSNEPTDTTAENDIWKAFDRPNLLSFFGGPTALPLTHVPGVVELGVRRIKEIIPPLKDTAPKPPVVAEPDAEAVEGDMEARFGRIVLEVWGDEPYGAKLPEGEPEDDDVYVKPKIANTSKGPVILPDQEQVEWDGKGRKPHDPLKDDITMFVEEKVLETLAVGMGISALWIQMARRAEDFGPEEEEAKSGCEVDGGEGAKKSKSKGKKKKSKRGGERYWYVGEVTMTFVSYYCRDIYKKKKKNPRK